MQEDKKRSDMLNFSLEDLKEQKTEDELAEEYIKGSGNRARVFLWVCMKDGIIKVDDAMKFFKEMGRDQIRGYLNGLEQYKILIKRQRNKKVYDFVLNKNNMYYERFIPIAKGVLGLK